MTTVKLIDIINSVDAINRLMAKEISAPTAYKIARLARKLNEELESFNKARESILSRFTEDGVLPEDKTDGVEEEINLLLDTEVTLDIKKINVQDLGGISVMPSDMFVLAKFINEPDVE